MHDERTVTMARVRLYNRLATEWAFHIADADHKDLATHADEHGLEPDVLRLFVRRFMDAGFCVYCADAGIPEPATIAFNHTKLCDACHAVAASNEAEGA